MERILIIEDDNLIRENLTELFSNEGYIVYVAENGKIGIQKAIENYPDLVISDIMMPELNGIEVYRLLRDSDNLSLIPFIFLSALNDAPTIREGMSLGADDFITKPFSNIDLLNTVRNRIKKSKKLKQEMEKLKNSILRSLPHEFLTPLNTIQGFSELILQTINDSEILDKLELKEHVEYIHEASFKLERIARNYILISEILTKYDHIPEKHLLIEHKVEEVIPLLEKFILNYANTRDREEDIHLNLETIYSLKINEENLLKIITEILDNSIKFSNKGSKIEVNGSIHGLDYAISIRDYGKGMNFEEVKQIDLFKQFNREKVEQQGLGMGLFIVQKILELYNGKIKINHELQTGIEITVLIPVVG